MINIIVLKNKFVKIFFANIYTISRFSLCEQLNDTRNYIKKHKLFVWVVNVGFGDGKNL